MRPSALLRLLIGFLGEAASQLADREVEAAVLSTIAYIAQGKDGWEKPLMGEHAALKGIRELRASWEKNQKRLLEAEAKLRHHESKAQA